MYLCNWLPTVFSKIKLNLKLASRTFYLLGYPCGGPHKTAISPRHWHGMQ